MGGNIIEASTLTGQRIIGALSKRFHLKVACHWSRSYVYIDSIDHDPGSLDNVVINIWCLVNWA